jgi:hypothetical protein
VTVTEADSGSTVCLIVGERLAVLLKGTPNRMWSPVDVTGSALRPAPDGRRTLVVGMTGGFFAADSTGAARLSASRAGCDEALTDASSCAAGQFVLTVIVRH